MSELDALTKSAQAIIASIRSGEMTPPKSGIVPALKRVRDVCEDTYNMLMSEYKPLSAAFFGPKQVDAKLEQRVEQEIDMLMRTLTFEESDFDENGILLNHVRARIIEESSARIEGRQKRAVRVPREKREKSAAAVSRDRGFFEFLGASYGKGPLVQAVVAAHAATVNDFEKLVRDFPDSLMKGYGIVKPLSVAQDISKNRPRYFMKPDRLIVINGENYAVCNQFTSDNIRPFVERARSLGYDIKEVAP